MKEENRLKEGTDESRRMLDRWTLELANWLMSMGCTFISTSSEGRSGRLLLGD